MVVRHVLVSLRPGPVRSGTPANAAGDGDRGLVPGKS
jgi:hypothetical protein